MIQLRSNATMPSLIQSNVSLSGGKGLRGTLHQMQYDVACVNATAQVGEWIEDWLTSLPGRIASYISSKMPTFSLPGASAASTPCDDTPVCKIPEGSYKATCNPPTVTYLPAEGECELTARCETIYAGLPLKQTSIRFAPGAKISVQNVNGTAVATPLQDTVENAFQRIASATGGLVTPSPTPENFTPVIEKVFDKILKDSAGSTSLDVAFVLDTTASMDPYIQQVKSGLVKFLEQLQSKKDTRVAILEYRDTGDLSNSDDFLNRVNTDFTNDFKKVDRAIQGLTVSGGGDTPEAVLDALQSAQSDLSWNRNAQRVVLLVGDAPPHPKTKDGRFDESEVLAQYQAVDTHIAVYPVLAQSGAK